MSANSSTSQWSVIRTALITSLFFNVASGVIVHKLTAKQLSLKYSVAEEEVTVEKPNNHVYVFGLKNDGDEAVESASLSIYFPVGVIAHSYVIKPDAIEASAPEIKSDNDSDKYDFKKYKISFPSLNPKDTVSVKIEIEVADNPNAGSKAPLALPGVDFRGKGVTATLEYVSLQ